MWTAGHCVFSPGIGFHSNFSFAPARHNGVNPFGTWTVRDAITLNGWANGLNEYDSGGLYMDRGGPAPGNFLVEQLGALGIAFDQPRGQHWEARGYPAAPPFDGEHHHVCAATWVRDDQPTGGPGDPLTVGIGCDMTGGSSGGPWMLDLVADTAPGLFINGNVSYGYVGVPDQYYSPYFTAGQQAIYDWMNGNPVP